MTVRELSEIAGVSDETIRRTGKKLFPGEIKNGIKTDFNKEQCFDIMKTVPKKNLVQMSKEPTQLVKLPTQTAEEVQQNAVLSMMESQQKFMIAVLDRLDKIGTQQPLQIEQPKEDYFSLVGYTSLNGIKTNRSELAGHGRTLKQMAVEKELTIKSIPDERWGKVNSYPIELLEEYFSA
ncbi:MAG: hypothetical protein PF693_10935 [Spirochaetia bacterium]|jgi:DNA-binding Lrp family transcriptional regulator|nr:hypothetical protein [Spirochaetia bacterium]